MLLTAVPCLLQQVPVKQQEEFVNPIQQVTADQSSTELSFIFACDHVGLDVAILLCHTSLVGGVGCSVWIQLKVFALGHKRKGVVVARAWPGRMTTKT